MGFTASVVGAVSGTACVLYTRAWRKAPYFTKPWEILAFGVIGGAWLANAWSSFESYTEDVARKLLMNKVARNGGALDAQYAELLGDSYERIMGTAAKAMPVAKDS